MPDSRLAKAQLEDNNIIRSSPHSAELGNSQTLLLAEKYSGRNKQIRHSGKGNTRPTYIPPHLRTTVNCEPGFSSRLDSKNCYIQKSTTSTTYPVPSMVEHADLDLPCHQEPITCKDDESCMLPEIDMGNSPLSVLENSGSNDSCAGGMAASLPNPYSVNAMSKPTWIPSPGALDSEMRVSLPSGLQNQKAISKEASIEGTDSVKATLPPHLRILERRIQKASQLATSLTPHSSVKSDNPVPETLMNNIAQPNDIFAPHLQVIPISTEKAPESGKNPTSSHMQNSTGPKKGPVPTSDLLNGSKPDPMKVKFVIPKDNLEYSAQGHIPHGSTDPSDITRLTHSKTDSKKALQQEISTEIQSITRMSQSSSDQSHRTVTGVTLQSMISPVKGEIQNTTTAKEVSVKSKTFDIPSDQEKVSIVLAQELATNEEPLENPILCGLHRSKSAERKNASLCANSGEEIAVETQKGNSSERLTEHVPRKVELDAEGYVIGGKPTLQYELVGWDGNWKPAPIEWDGRPLFDNNDKRHIDSMERWMHKRVISAMENPLKLDVTLPLFVSGEGPASGMSTFLWPPYPVDWTTKMPDDPYSHTKERREQTSSSSMENFQKVRHEKHVKREKAKKNFYEANEEAIRTYVAPPNPHIPKAHIYIRPVQHSDVPQITALYNFYVKFSPIACEIADTTEDDWRGIVRGADSERLPFLVAISKSGKEFNSRYGYGDRGVGSTARAPNGRRDNRRYGPIQETILGFAFAEDYAGAKTAFQYTAEMQCFVHHQWLHVGIGKSLVDRIVAAMDPNYESRHGTVFLAENTLHYEMGGRREIHRIMINIGYYPKDDHALKWQMEWLAKEWDFEHVGTLPAVGFKNNRAYNVALLMKETNVCFGASSKPWNDWFMESPRLTEV